MEEVQHENCGRCLNIEIKARTVTLHPATKIEDTVLQ